MKTQRSANNKRLLLGIGAAACTLVLARNRRLRRAALAMAAVGLGSALVRRERVEEPVTSGLAAAPELSRSAEVDGILMRWEEHGADSAEAVPIVMVHGIPTHPRLWRYVIPQVQMPGVRCLAWELVGFGWSMEEGLARDISLASQADYLYRWLEYMGIRQAVFVGHDLGGGVIQQLLVRHPQLCQGLVLMDCVAYDNWPVTAVRLARTQRALIERLPTMLLKPLFLAGLFNLGHDNGPRRRASAALHWQPYDRPVGPRAFARQLAHLDARQTQTLAGRLSVIDAPCHVLWGDADPLSIESGQRLATELGAPLTPIPGARHFTPEDHPVEVCRAIRSVLAQVRETR